MSCLRRWIPSRAGRRQICEGNLRILKATTAGRPGSGIGAACCIALLVLPSSWRAQTAGTALADVAARFQEQVAAIAAGAGAPERASAITGRLQALGIHYRIEPFDARDRKGANIVAELPGWGSGLLLLGAHYDRVAVGQGSIDNASSCALLLELLDRLSANPLKNLTVHAAFFDLEEAGLLGSRAYIRSAQKARLPAFYVNFDIFGYGDTLWIMSPREDAPLARAMQEAGRELKFSLRTGRDYPPSDHLPFLSARVETISVTLIDGEEIDAVLQLLKSLNTPGAPAKKPRILDIIHTANDTVDQIDSAAVGKAYPVVERGIRLLDEKQ